MNLGQTTYQEIQDRLNAFKRRYYLNFTLQSLGAFLIVSLALLLLLSLIEWLFPNDSQVRAWVLFSYLGLEIAGLIYLVALPLMRFFGIWGVLSAEELSRIVARRESRVNDKLQNILLLDNMLEKKENPLLKAAIEQKSLEIKDIPFHLSADIRRGLDFLKVSILVMILVIITAWGFPDIYNYGTRRIIFFNSDIHPPAPFSMELQSADEAIRHERFPIRVLVDGNVLPKEIILEIDGRQIPMRKAHFNEYEYIIPNVRKEFSFRAKAAGYATELKRVEVMDRPAVIEMTAGINFPKYLNRDRLEIKNSGNLTVPEGSSIEWKITTLGGESIELGFPDKTRKLKLDDQVVKFDSNFRVSVDYTISALSSNGLFSDTVNYRLEVIPDKHPMIEVLEQADSMGTSSTYYGRISDDYGITEFKFGYRKNDDQISYEKLPFNMNLSADDFVYEIQWKRWDLEPGDQVEFFFELWDNDGLNGRKYSRSRKFNYRLADEKELKENRKQMREKVESDLEKALKEARQLNKEIDDLRKNLLDEKKIDWPKRKKIEDLIQRNAELKKNLTDIEKNNHQKNKLEERLSPTDEMIQKREDLQELIRKVMDEEMLEKLKELEKLMEELGREQMNEKLEDMEMSNEQVEKELDRALELFKQLEFEQKLNDVVEDLEKMEDKQKSLMERTEIGKEKLEEMSKEQESLNEEFKDWEKDFEELMEMNKELENKKNLNDMPEEREETKESMQKADDALQKNQRKNSSENQGKAGESMSKMKQSLKELQSGMQKQAVEDLESLRGTLENLLELSFEQEDLMEKMNGMRGDDPRFNDLTRKQRGIMEGLEVVEDSLVELGKRIAQIKPTINKELTEAKSNMGKSIKNMTSRKMSDFRANQQFSMTSLNNLALLLSEVVEQLQQQMMMSMGQCSKPGDQKSGAGNMKKLQEKLNQQLEEMKKMMEEKMGKQEGSGKGGNKEAESLAKMAAEQAKIREMLRNMEKNANQEDSRGMKKIGDMMEETERDIVNRQITKQTLLRQEKILTRLLESEKSERERDKDEKRESNESREEKKGNLLDLKQYYKAKSTNHEELIKESIGYNRYYKKKVEEYFKNIQ